MKKSWTYLTANRKRRIVALVTAVCLICVSGAIAYYLLQASGTATGSNTLGTTSSTVDLSSSMTVNVPGGLTPGQSGDVTVNFTNMSGHQISVTGASLGSAGITIDAAHASAGCQASWFSLGAQDGGRTFPWGSSPGDSDGMVYSAPLTFTSTSSDQSACEGATISVPITFLGTAQ